MENPLHRLRLTVLLALGVMLVGVLGFHLFHGLSFLDSLYMTVITMSTVGYREVGGEPTTVAKIFTILFILGGVGVLLYAFTTVLEVALDEKTRLYFRARANQRKAQAMENHYVVCGIGRVGRAVAEELATSGVPFVVIDSEVENLNLAASLGWTAVHGDATDDRILSRVNLDRARALFACVDTDATNLFIVVSARALNPRLEVAARVVDEHNLEKFRRAGATHVYSPYHLLGRRMARSITRPRVLELLDLALEQTNYDLTIDECRIPDPSPYDEKSLADTRFRQKTGAIVLAVIRPSGVILHNPTPDTILHSADVLVILGTPAQLNRARDELRGAVSTRPINAEVEGGSEDALDPDQPR